MSAQQPKLMHSKTELALHNNYTLDGIEPVIYDDFELEPSSEVMAEPELKQAELYLPSSHPEQPEATPQIAFDGMQPSRFKVTLQDGRSVFFQHAHNLLDSLESQGVDINFQCREGYCGSCRIKLLQGEVHYLLDPMAWLGEDEVLTCCTVPKTNLVIDI